MWKRAILNGSIEEDCRWHCANHCPADGQVVLSPAFVRFCQFCLTFRWMMFIQNHFWEDFALDLTGFNMLFHKCHVMISHRGDFKMWDSPPGLDPWLYFLEKKLVNVYRKTYGKTYGYDSYQTHSHSAGCLVNPGWLVFGNSVDLLLEIGKYYGNMEILWNI